MTLLDTLLPPELADRIGTAAAQARQWGDEQVTTLLGALHDIRDALDAMDDRAETIRRPAQADADATGQAVIRIPARLGFQREVERLTITAPGAAATVAEVFVGDQADTALVDRIVDARRWASDADYYVPAGADLIIVCTGVTVGAKVSAGVQFVQVPVEV